MDAMSSQQARSSLALVALLHLRESGGEKDAMAQKIEAGAAGYRARDQVEVGDVALGQSGRAS